MRFLLQRPLPDELLSSALMRTCIQFGVSIKTLMTALHGHGNAPGFFHMSHIGVYAQLLNLEPKSLLYTATVFPSLVAFQPFERRLGYIAQAIKVNPDIPLQLSALQSTAAHVPYRRFCSRCALSEKARYGWAYWHVSHNLPGVSFCSLHNIRLRESALPTTAGNSRWSYHLPGSVPSVLRKRPKTPFEQELNRLALTVQSNHYWPALGPLSTFHYRRRLEQAGLVDPSRQVNAQAARKWVGDLLRTAPSCAALLNSEPRLSWVEVLLRQHDQLPFPAYKHLVIDAAIAASPKPATPSLNHKSTGNTQKYLGDLDALKAKEVDARIRQLVKGGARFTLRSVLEELEVWTKLRHARGRFPLVKKAIERHRRSLIQSRNLQRRSPRATLPKTSKVSSL